MNANHHNVTFGIACFSGALWAIGFLCGHAQGGPPDEADWLTLVQDNDLLIAEDALGLGDTQRKDYAWGDLNLNGWVDLIVMRKQPWGIGKRENVLFVNEEGVLVDRTVEYASAVAQDQLPVGVTDEGFLTPTNDVASVLADLLNNGWLDLVTAVTISDDAPMHIGYPRVYVNLGNDGRGQWQGFRFEHGRIPEMLSYSGESDFNPRFEAVAAGDVTNDGFADLWFGDTDYAGVGGLPQPQGADFNDRLLANQGAANPGYFADVTETTFSGLVPMFNQPFPVSSSSWAAAIADINQSGLADIVKLSAVSWPYYIGAAYNNPANPGFFTTGSYQALSVASPTYFSLGDLNNNNRLDLVMTDDGTDRYRLNLSTDANGHVVWGPNNLLPEQSTPTGGIGFGGNSVIVDLDNVGWNDIIIADAHVAIPGCNRHSNFYRNRQDAPNVTFENASDIIPQADRTGVFDVAAFDLTGNGWLDLVLGRCVGTDVWVNVPPTAPCPADLTGDGNVGVADLLILLGAWGLNPGHPADLDGDGSVGVSDLLILLSEWGSCP